MGTGDVFAKDLPSLLGLGVAMVVILLLLVGYQLLRVRWIPYWQLGGSDFIVDELIV